jgi:hypothetical protein
MSSASCWRPRSEISNTEDLVVGYAPRSPDWIELSEWAGDDADSLQYAVTRASWLYGGGWEDCIYWMPLPEPPK